MANDLAWQEGFELGKVPGMERREHKEEEHEQRIKDLIDTRTGLLGNYSFYKDDAAKQAEINKSLLDNAAAIREAFSPDSHPGAIAKYGRLLMEKLHMVQPRTTEPLTVPTDTPGALPQQPTGDKLMTADGKVVTDETPRSDSTTIPASMTQKEREEFKRTGKLPARIQKQLALHNKDTQTVKALEAGTPPSAEETAAQQSKIEIAKTQSEIEALRNTLSKVPNITDEQINDAILSKLGVKGLLEKGNWVYTPGHLPDGTPMPLLIDKDSARTKSVQGEDITAPEGWVADQKPKPGANSTLNVGLDSYAKSHGLNSFDDIPDEKKEAVNDYVIRKQALDRAFPKSTTSTSLRQDMNGNWVPVTVTSYTTPGGGIELVDPMPMAQGATTPGAANGKPPSATATPPAPHPTGGVHVGQPLFAGKTKTVDDARKEYKDADALVKFADKVKNEPNNAFAQKSLIERMGRTMSGRFQMAQYDIQVKDAGVANSMEYWYNYAFRNAALPQSIVDNMVQTAHDFRDSAWQELEAAITQQQQTLPKNAQTPVTPPAQPPPASGGDFWSQQPNHN
jgi:hypothetical protein